MVRGVEEEPRRIGAGLSVRFKFIQRLLLTF